MSVQENGRQILVQVERLSDGPEIVEGLRLVRVAPEETSNVMAALNNRPDVIYAEPNWIRQKDLVPNDARYGEQYALKNIGQQGGTVGADVKAEPAWDITTGSRSIVVGVVDEGIDINHPDLKDNIWVNPAEIPGNGIDDDGNGYVDDVNGWDFYHNDKTVFDGDGTFPTDVTDAHGTHVAGTIGASGNNGIGVAGVNWQVSLMSLKFLGPVSGSSANLLQAYAYARAMRELWTSSAGTKGANLKVLNNSYGGLGFSQAELDAIKSLGESGILFVAAAGNEGINNDHYLRFPACYKATNILSVGSTDRFNGISSFSNFGLSVNLRAPGEAILSTTPNGTYALASGTSMSAPHVSGAAALVSAVNPSITLQRLRVSLLLSGDVLPGNVARTQTQRRLNVLSALQTAVATDTTPPAAIADFHLVGPPGMIPSFRWTAPGDDGSAGRAALYEVRFTDAYPQTSEQFESGIEFLAPPPAQTGTEESVEFNLPFRHPNGFFGIRAIDKVGNKGPITAVQMIADVNDADPFIINESNAEPLSTGGTQLALNGDDKIEQVDLHFPFRYFTGAESIVYVSTNGAIYLQSAPYFLNPPIAPNQISTDSASSVPAFGGLTMIAGLWDDLRTDRRAGDGVYMVQPDPGRAIFRWRAVTHNSAPDGTTRGENPVNFEIELRSTGEIIMRYGDGNHSVFPVVGASAGGPDTYLIASHSASVMSSLANAPTISLQRRRPPANDLGLSMSAVPEYVGQGQLIYYTIAARTFGPDNALNTRVTDALPPGLSFVSCAVFPTGSCSLGANNTVVAELGSINPGATNSFYLTAMVNAPAGSSLVNTASVSGLFQDLNPINNTASFTASVVQDNGLANVKAISAGDFHTVALKLDGTALAWGNNNNGGLGDGSYTRQTRPVQVALDRITAISAGGDITFFLRDDGTVWQTSYPTGNFFNLIPTQISGITDVKGISTFNGAHCLAVKTDGTVWSWGLNDFGQLGNGQAGAPRSVPGQVPGLSNIVSVSAGAQHSFALSADGTIWGWGRNQEGEVGDGSSFNNRLSPVHLGGINGVTALSAGYQHNMALRSDGTIWVWGWNSSGQLGSTNYNFAQTTPVQVAGIANVINIDAGNLQSLAVKADGTAWAWGGNNQGQLGDGTFIGHATPARINGLTSVFALTAGLYHGAALLNDGSVKSWGLNTAGQLGDGTTVNHYSAVPVSGLPTVSSPGFDRYTAEGFTTPQYVRITCYTPGAAIHYTTDDRDPTEADPAIISGALLRLAASTNLRVKAWKPGMLSSTVSTIYLGIQIGTNQIDDARNFTKQQYLDFLNRNPDQGGWDYWTSQITQCGNDWSCVHRQRIGVSAAFFIELEFQQTGYVVYRFYRVAYGTRANAPSRANITFQQFIADRALLVGGSGLPQNTINLANAFVARPEFKMLYPDDGSMTNARFVNTLFDTASLVPYTAERQQQIDAMNNNAKTRAQVLLDVIEINELKTREYNAAFVLMQYFGYLRRNPDQLGYDFWLNVLNAQPNNFGGMVCSFLTSTEYQQRFGTAITRSNQDCSQ